MVSVEDRDIIINCFWQAVRFHLDSDGLKKVAAMYPSLAEEAKKLAESRQFNEQVTEMMERSFIKRSIRRF